MFEIYLSEEAHQQLKKLDKSIKIKIARAIDSLQYKDSGKKLKKFPYFFVKKVGQYRVVYTVDTKEKKKIVYFIGDHKEYEKWYTNLK